MYEVGDMMSIQTMQFDNITKLKQKQLGTDDITTAKNDDLNEIEK